MLDFLLPEKDITNQGNVRRNDVFVNQSHIYQYELILIYKEIDKNIDICAYRYICACTYFS